MISTPFLARKGDRGMGERVFSILRRAREEMRLRTISVGNRLG